MGMSEKEFGEMGPPAFFLKLLYFNKSKLQRQQFIAEVIREHAFQLINIQLDAKHKLKSSDKLWRYQWDKAEEGAKTRLEQTPEELKEMVRKANKIFSGI